LFPLIRYGQHRKWGLQKFFIAMGMSLPSCHLATREEYIEPQTYKPNNYSIAVGIRCCMNVFHMLFAQHKMDGYAACNDRRNTHTNTQNDGRDLWSTLLRWAQLPLYTHQVSHRLVQAFIS
jgi:hypothetical protein